MRLLDLFENNVVINLDEAARPVEIKATDRFRKEAKEFARSIPDFSSRLENFLTKKTENPNVILNKNDYPRNPMNHYWGHAHLFFGKAIIWYKFFENILILASITNHKAIDNTGAANTSMNNFLANINPNNTSDINLNFLDQTPDTHDTEKPQATSTSQDKVNIPLEERIQIWTKFYTNMAKHFGDRQILEKFAERSDDEKFKEYYQIFLNTFNLLDYWIDTPRQVELAKKILAETSLPLKELKELIDNGFIVEDIAKYFACLPTTMQNAIDKYFPKEETPEFSWTEENKTKLKKMFDDKKTNKEMAAAFGITPNKLAYALDIFYPTREVRGSRQAVITSQEAAEMTLAFSLGQSISTIAKNFKVPPARVSGYIKDWAEKNNIKLDFLIAKNAENKKSLK